MAGTYLISGAISVIRVCVGMLLVVMRWELWLLRWHDIPHVGK